MAEDPVKLEIEDGVATVKLNQPEVRNALTHELRTAFRDIVGSLEFNEDVRCVVITGAGDHFMAGGDIRAMVKRLKVDEIERRKLILEGIHLLHLPLFATNCSTACRYLLAARIPIFSTKCSSSIG